MPFTSLFAVVTLALGIAGTTAAFGLVEYFQLSALHVRQPGNLVAIAGLDANGQAASLTLPLITELSHAELGLGAVAGYLRNGTLTVRVQGRLLRASVAAVTSEYYATLGLRPLTGQFSPGSREAGTEGTASQGAIISHAFWMRQLAGDQNAIGGTLEIEGFPFEIIGVTPPEFSGLEVGAPTDVTMPLEQVAKVLNLPANWPVPVTHALGRLAPGASVESVRARVTALWPSLLEAGLPPSFSRQQRDRFQMIRPVVDSAASGFSYVRDRYSRSLFSLFALSVLMLFVTAGNVSALLLARAGLRLPEFTVRAALGATRSRLCRQLFVEAAALSALGGLLALPMASWGHYVVSRSVIQATTPNATPIGLQAPNLLLASTMVLITALLAGLGPAWLLSRTSSQAALRFRGSAPQASRWGRRVLIAQVAGAVVLVAISAFFVRTLLNLRSGDHGFRTDGVVLARVAPQPGGYSQLQDAVYYRQLVNELARVPGVSAVALSKSTPASGVDAPLTQPAALANTQENMEAVPAALEVVSPRFFEAIGIRLMRGRDFDWHDDLGAAPVAILSESVAERLFPDEDPVGAHIKYGAEPRHQELRVVAVASDANLGTLYTRGQPTVYVSWLQQPPPYARWPTVEIQSALPLSAVAGGLRQVIEGLGHEYVEDLRTMQQQIDRSTARESLLATLASFFGVLATVLVCLGLAAALLQMVARQQREIGVRLAIGAPTWEIRATIFRTSIAVTIVGILCGAPLAFLAVSMAQRALPVVQADRLEPAVAAAAILLLVAIVAAAIPAARAARVDPSAVLRSE